MNYWWGTGYVFNLTSETRARHALDELHWMWIESGDSGATLSPEDFDWMFCYCMYLFKGNISDREKTELCVNNWIRQRLSDRSEPLDWPFMLINLYLLCDSNVSPSALKTNKNSFTFPHHKRDPLDAGHIQNPWMYFDLKSQRIEYFENILYTRICTIWPLEDQVATRDDKKFQRLRVRVWVGGFREWIRQINKNYYTEDK